MLGMMSNEDILNAMKDNEMAIATFDPYKPDCRLTPAGFNFTFTRFIVSINENSIYDIFEEETKPGVSEIFFYLKPGDTALALTRESIWVSDKIAGTFHSKVTYVSQGLGHISTTLDPGWKGQLLISINNPNREPIKIVIGGKRKGEIEYHTFITLCLFRLITPAVRIDKTDNRKARLDILCKVLEKNSEMNESYKLFLHNLNQLQLLIGAQRDPDLNERKVTADEISSFKVNHDEVLKKMEELYPEILKGPKTSKNQSAMNVKIKKINPDATIPQFAREGDAGLDLCSVERRIIPAGKHMLIKTGLAIELPKNTEAQIRPRSGLALHNGITVLNTPGTIDQGYRGEIGVILINHGEEDFTVEKNMRIAQMVIKPIYDIDLIVVEELQNTQRGEAGFGSTGRKGGETVE